jgi:cytidylate kinase
VEERAERRYKELLHKGYQPIISEILSDIKERDRLDIERETSPLKKAEDAIEIDATHLTIDQVVEKVYQLCSKDNH